MWHELGYWDTSFFNVQLSEEWVIMERELMRHNPSLEVWLILLMHWGDISYSICNINYYEMDPQWTKDDLFNFFYKEIMDSR